MTQHPVRLEPDEHDLVGRWVMSGDNVESDPVCRRIEALTEQVLEVLADSVDGWSTLYRDPADQRLWEHTYPAGEMHGGGPPRLSVISEPAATVKYALPWGRTRVERRRVGLRAEQYLARRMSFEDFMRSVPEEPVDDEVAELVDLIEHEPKRGGLFGAGPAEYDRHMARVEALVRLLLKRDEAG
jgi:hypothetical protein